MSAALAGRQVAALEALDAAHRRALEVVDPAVVALITAHVEHTLAGGPAPPPPVDDRARALAAIVEQMLVDVAGTSDELVQQANPHFADGGVADAVMAAYIVEARTRLRIAGERLWSAT